MILPGDIIWANPYRPPYNYPFYLPTAKEDRPQSLDHPHKELWTQGGGVIKGEGMEETGNQFQTLAPFPAYKYSKGETPMMS